MVNNSNITVLDLITKWVDEVNLDLRCVAGRKGINNKITPSINRPGLALNNTFVGFGGNRIQFFGKGEIQFLYELEKDNRLEDVLKTFFSYDIPCCVVSHCNEHAPPKALEKYCEQFGAPLLLSTLSSANLSTNLYRVINELFAPKMVRHGVFMEVHDLGVLIIGESGIGKSEIALELIEKNRHRFIADDVVILRKMNEQLILGSSINSKQHQHSLEIRGLGLVNISQIYGIGTTLAKKRLHFVIELLVWDDSKVNFDRSEQIKTIDIMGVAIPYIVIHIKAGRNVPLLIETAAIKQRLIYMGYHGKENPYLW